MGSRRQDRVFLGVGRNAREGRGPTVEHEKCLRQRDFTVKRRLLCACLVTERVRENSKVSWR